MPHSLPLLQIQGVSRSFFQKRGFSGIPHEVKAVQEVTLTLHKGKTLGIVGESGSGKSTLARMVVRLLQPDSGDIKLDGQSIFTGTAAFKRTLPSRLQMIFQDPFSSLNPRLKIGKSIIEPLLANGFKVAKANAKAAELLAQVGLDPAAAELYPHEFSGGQRQRVALARAVALEPDIVVCDEPVSSLDASVQAQVLNLLKDLQDAHGLSYLFISHDLAVISHMSDFIAVMYLGHIVEYCPADTLFSTPLHPYTLLLLEASAGADTYNGAKAAAHAQNPDQTKLRSQAEHQPQTMGATSGQMDNKAPASPRTASQQSAHKQSTSQQAGSIQTGGCSFYPRCTFAEPACMRGQPPLLEVQPAHFVRCHRVYCASI